MGQVNCKSDKSNMLLWAIIQRKLENKDTTLDKKIHNEYLSLVGLSNHKFEIEVENPIQVKSTKRISTFKSWYKIAYEERKSNKSKTTINLPQNESKINFLKTDNIGFDLSMNKSKSEIDDAKSFTTFKIDEKNTNFINQAEIGLKRYYNSNEKSLLKMISEGPPESFRWISWVIASRLPLERTSEFFHSYLDKKADTKVVNQIKKDLNRTLSDILLFNLDSTQNMLFRVLIAYANYDREVAYCQGINFIVGFLLIVSDFNEIDTFYMLVSLLNNNVTAPLRGLFINEFPLLKLLLFQFNIIFAEYYPKLKKHFEKLEVPDELWVSKWFQTLNSLLLPIDQLLRLWDCLISNDLSFLFKFVLSLLKIFEKDLLKFDDLSDIAEYFNDLNPYLMNKAIKNKVKIDIEVVIEDAKKIIISEEKLRILKEKFENQSGDIWTLNSNEIAKTDVSYSSLMKNGEIFIQTESNHQFIKSIKNNEICEIEEEISFHSDDDECDLVENKMKQYSLETKNLANSICLNQHK